MARWSRLTLALSPLLDRIGPAPLSDESKDLLEVIVEDHDLQGEDSAPWMVKLIDDIVRRDFRRRERFVPSRYPFGEMGLANVLADIEVELFPLGIDDQGDGVLWPIPALGMRVEISRETRDDNCRIRLERLKAETR